MIKPNCLWQPLWKEFMGLLPILPLGLYLLLILVGTLGGVFNALTRSTAVFAAGTGILGIVVTVWMKPRHFDAVFGWLLG